MNRKFIIILCIVLAAIAFVSFFTLLDTEKKMTNADVTVCTGVLDTYQKQQCWDEQLQRVLKSEGLDAALEYFVALYKTEPEVPKACHGWGHLLGKAAYGLFKNGENVPLRTEASYCGYGYFHGFIAELIRDTGDVKKTLDFCDYVVAGLQDTLPSIKSSCVHGVGHGASAMFMEEPENWGEFEQILQKGIAMCEAIYVDKTDLLECVDGVFNGSQLALFNSQYGMNFEQFMELEDPFWYCQKQEEEYKESCYYEFAAMFWMIFDNDVVAMMQYALENVEDLQTRGPRVMAKISSYHINSSLVKNTHEDSMEACAIVPTYMFDACFNGILNGFIGSGEPNNVHPKGYAFCGETALSEVQQDKCYEEFTKMLRWMYTEEQMKTACEYVRKIKEVKECQEVLL